MATACERCVLTDGGAQDLPLEVFLERVNGCQGCPLREGPDSSPAVLSLLARLREAGRGMRKAGQRVRKLEADLQEMEEAARRTEERITTLSQIQKAASREADELLRAKAVQLDEKEQALLAMSTPVIQVWEGVLAVPLIGTVDEERAGTLGQRLLQAVVATRCRRVIVDLTGVLDLDANTARHLLRIEAATRLLGAQLLLCGMRPHVTQALAHFITEHDPARRLSTAQTLRDALRSCGVGAR